MRLQKILPISLVVCSLFLPLPAHALDPAKKAAIEAEIPKVTANILAQPDQAHLYFTRACMYRVLEKWDLAFQDYNKAVEKKVGDWLDEAYEGRGICRMRLGAYKDALTDFSTALKYNGNLYDARKNHALIMLRMGYPDRAQSELTTILGLRQAKSDPSILISRARARNALRDFAGARADADASLAINRDDVDALQERACSYIGLNEPQKAIDQLTPLLGRFPKNGGLWGALAMAYYGMGNYKETVLNANKASELGYQDSALFADAADSYAHLGQHQHAVSMATSSIGINPNCGLAYFVRGQAWQHLKRADLSKQDLAKANQLGFKTK